jgi:ankyrin repeat protein
MLVATLGADKEAKDNIGWTAVHFVAALGLKDTARLLIKSLDVDKNAQNTEGKTALNLAQKW